MTIRPTVPDVMPIVASVYARSASGCCLHILTDDGNVKDADASFCVTTANERDHADCYIAAVMLHAMTRTQRRRVVALVRRLPL